MKNIKVIKKKLDDVFSLNIRLRDTDKNGYGKCITCSRIKHFTQGDNGHYIKRQHLVTRWNEKNCAFQCKHCNAFEQGKDAVFREKLVAIYGEQSVLLLEASKRTHTKPQRHVYLILISEFQAKITNLMKTKNFELSNYYKRLLK
jgi:hypothetical protein